MLQGMLQKPDWCKNNYKTFCWKVTQLYHEIPLYNSTIQFYRHAIVPWHTTIKNHHTILPYKCTIQEHQKIISLKCLQYYSLVILYVTVDAAKPNWCKNNYKKFCWKVTQLYHEILLYNSTIQFYRTLKHKVCE